MKCDIVMPVWNQLGFTRDCVSSLARNTLADYRLIVIDNASDAGTRRYLDSLKAAKGDMVSVVTNVKNLGFIKAVNKGIALSDAPYLCILNNDTLVTKNWLTEMMAIAESRGDIGIVNPSSNTLGQRPARGEPVDLYAERLKNHVGEFIELGAAVGFCMLIKRSVIDKIGLFDEVYGMGNFEDTDFSRRAVKEGYRCVRACGAYVYHREQASFNKLKTYEDDFRRNREIYEFRWGRPRRVAYIIDAYDANILKRIEAESLKLARNGDWVWSISKGGVDMPSHSNIHHVRLPEKWFYPRALFTVLKRKKKFNTIFVGNEKLARVLTRLEVLHKARVEYY